MNKYQEIEISKLKNWKKNPRQNDQAIEAVAKSIEEFGFQSPVIVQRSSMMILAGHTRVKAAKHLGLDSVPVKFADLDDRTAERFAIADNQTATIAEWDEDLLADVLADFDEEDFEGLGFSDQELHEIIGNVAAGEEDSEEPPPKPEPVQTDQTFWLMKGNCLERLKELEDGSIDAVVTDPPYEIAFMSKSWDNSGIAYSSELWNEVFRVLKDGGHVISFCATRTIHGMTTAIEKAGFEIRDMIMWCFESGFPKSTAIDQMIDKKLGVFDKRKVLETRDNGSAGTMKMALVADNISEKGNGGYNNPDRTEFHVTAPYSTEAQKWAGWGTALKPAYEPAVLARKPLIGSLAENVLEHGVGGINIDSCRFAYGDPIWFGDSSIPNLDAVQRQQEESTDSVGGGFGAKYIVGKTIRTFKPEGRFPANIVRFKKAQRSEREAGLDHLSGKTPAAVQHQQDTKPNQWEKGINDPRAGAGRTAGSVKNHHPTVKPVDLMRWLIRLVVPEGGVVLDPFLGSGTTACAAVLENRSVIGCEMTEEYWEIIEGRVEHAKRQFLQDQKENTENNE